MQKLCTYPHNQSLCLGVGEFVTGCFQESPLHKMNLISRHLGTCIFQLNTDFSFQYTHSESHYKVTTSGSKNTPPNLVPPTRLLKMKLLFSTWILVSLFLSSSFLVDAVLAPTPAPAAGSCDAKCDTRCGKAGNYKNCFKYCSICCNKCNGCVPSGPYANKSECPCYRDMLSSKGTSKCP